MKTILRKKNLLTQLRGCMHTLFPLRYAFLRIRKSNDYNAIKQLKYIQDTSYICPLEAE